MTTEKKPPITLEQFKESLENIVSLTQWGLDNGEKGFPFGGAGVLLAMDSNYLDPSQEPESGIMCNFNGQAVLLLQAIDNALESDPTIAGPISTLLLKALIARHKGQEGGRNV